MQAAIIGTFKTNDNLLYIYCCEGWRKLHIDQFLPRESSGLCFCVSSNNFFSLFLTIDMGVVISENGVEPGTIMPLSFGIHCVNSLTVRLFQSQDALNKKLHLAISRLIFGNITREFTVLSWLTVKSS